MYNSFIMLPTVDFCFKELMQNPKVRQGFISALLSVEPKAVEKTELMPTILPRKSADDKLGILDVRVKLADGMKEGRMSKLAELVQHHQARGLSVNEIADILMESPEQIRKIMEQDPV